VKIISVLFEYISFDTKHSLNVLRLDSIDAPNHVPGVSSRGTLRIVKAMSLKLTSTKGHEGAFSQPVSLFS